MRARCPACGSEDIRRDRAASLLNLVVGMACGVSLIAANPASISLALALGLTFLICGISFSACFECRRCGHEWWQSHLG